MKKTTMAAVTAVSVAGAIAVGLGAVSSWFTNWNVKTWFGRGGNNAVVQPENPDTPDIPDNNNNDGAIVTDGESNGISLMSAKLPRAAYAANGISAQADTAYVLTATVTPSDATDLRVQYTAAWSNADSEWANGKAVTDYVTVTQEDFGLSATVECKQAFGEQVVITCASIDNAAAYATCMVDYRVKILGNSFGGLWVASSGDMSCSFNSANISSGSLVIGNLYIGSVMSFFVGPTKSIGSLADTYACTVTFTPTSDIMRLLTDKTAKTVTVKADGKAITSLDSAFVESLFGSGVYGTSAFYKACSGTMTSTAIKCVVTYSDGETEYSYTYYLRIDDRSVKVPVSDVGLDNPSIIF